MAAWVHFNHPILDFNVTLTREKERKIYRERYILFHEGFGGVTGCNDTLILYPREEILLKKTFSQKIAAITVGAATDDQAPTLWKLCWDSLRGANS